MQLLSTRQSDILWKKLRLGHQNEIFGDDIKYRVTRWLLVTG